MIHILFHSRISKNHCCRLRFSNCNPGRNPGSVYEKKWLDLFHSRRIAAKKVDLNPSVRPLFIFCCPVKLGRDVYILSDLKRKYFPLLVANDTNNEHCNFVHIVSPLFNELKIDSCFFLHKVCDFTDSA